MYPYYSDDNAISAQKTDVSPETDQSFRIFKLLNNFYNKKLSSAKTYSSLMEKISDDRQRKF